MVFEVKATHRVTSTGAAACEIHPDVFVDECGRAFTTGEAVVVAGIAVVIRPAEEAEYVFVVDDDATELAVNWIGVLADDPMAVERIEQRHTGRGVSSAGIRPDIDWASLRREERTVQFELRATHRVKATRELACEIYPDVLSSSVGSLSPGGRGWRRSRPVTLSNRYPIIRKTGLSSAVWKRRWTG